ncbi:polysaccharide biosynthesis/export family protein [Leptolyngbya sp. NIES-2104]|uniref:polysaccharide biosynthesis/export family protein n=1 Tax=Leptolyngbya sp. NIES-2104 TaxID=1552121 RepID=UPI0006ECB80B|nr:polysaccharide biosynthesis/export family protein [Leptolyngbya sp. NIES-2104]GAP95225.1 capsular polysaccharide biosynthesis/export periplasmic protein WcbA [Leptolyngbya sp. NIES-2104]
MRLVEFHFLRSAPYGWITSLFMAGVYSIAPASSIWLSARSVSAQPSAPLPTRPSPLELIEQARQKLRDSATPEVPTTSNNTSIAPPVNSFNLYRLGAGDTISVQVQRFADLNFQATIDQEGNITAPLLGKVPLQGLTIAQAQERIQQGVNRFVINPVVFVALTGQRPVLVTVTGEIAKPGLYTLTLPRTSAALLLAGGATGRADLRSVQVKRSLSDGSILEEKLDLVTPLQEGTPLPDLKLQDGDVVVIPKLSEQEQNYDRLLMARSTLVKPQITVRLLSYANNGLGTLTLPNGSTFLDALTAARPGPDNSNLRRIALIRFDPIQKKAVTRDIDARSILSGNMAQNVQLEDNDVIVIGRNLVGRITYALNTFTQPFRDVLGFLLFFRELRSGADSLFGPTGRE